MAQCEHLAGFSRTGEQKFAAQVRAETRILVKRLDARDIGHASRHKVNERIHAPRTVRWRLAFHKVANQRNDVFLFFSRVAKERIHDCYNSQTECPATTYSGSARSCRTAIRFYWWTASKSWSRSGLSGLRT